MLGGLGGLRKGITHTGARVCADAHLTDYVTIPTFPTIPKEL